MNRIIKMLRIIIWMSVIINFGCIAPQKLDKTEATKLYIKEKEGKSEKFKVDFERQVFSYFNTNINGENLVLNGSFVINNSIIEFEFPAHSEYDGLPFFPAENIELNYLDSAQHFEIEIDLIDIETKKEIYRHIPILVSPMRSTSVHKSENPKTLIAKTQSSKIELSFVRPFKEKDIIEIPKKGKYRLTFYMISPKTLVSYETTNKGCFMSTINPTVKMKICRMVNGEIESFDFNQDCFQE